MKALTLSLGIFALARAAPAPSPDPLSGATIVDQQVTVQVFPDQPPVTLNGTLQEVEAQLRQLNPDWDSTTASGSNQARAAVPDDVNAAAGLEKRVDEDWSKAKVICSQGNWGYVNNLAYNEIVNIYENSWRSNTAAVLRPGPKKCGRLYCAYRTAFYACNDVRRPQPVFLDSSLCFVYGRETRPPSFCPFLPGHCHATNRQDEDPQQPS